MKIPNRKKAHKGTFKVHKRQTVTTVVEDLKGCIEASWMELQGARLRELEHFLGRR